MIFQCIHAIGIECHAIRANKYHAPAIEPHITGRVLGHKPPGQLPLRLQRFGNVFIADHTIGQGIIDRHLIPIQPHRITPHQQHHALMKMQQRDLATAWQVEILLAVDNGIHRTFNLNGSSK